MKIALSNVRLAFPQLFEAKAFQGSEPAFAASFIMPPNHPAVKQIHAAIDEIGQNKWGGKWPAIKKELTAKDKLPIHDGDTKANYSGFEGNLFVSSRNKVRPLVLDRDKTPLTQSDGKPYAGAFVNASIELWCQDNEYGKRINATLRGVQFYKDGEAFAGGGSASDDEFEDLGTEEDALV
jgi:hypothetical protein